MTVASIFWLFKEMKGENPPCTVVRVANCKSAKHLNNSPSNFIILMLIPADQQLNNSSYFEML